MIATFNTDMSFMDFPFDKQRLTMQYRVNWDSDSVPLYIDSVRVRSKKAPGWIVQSISAAPGFEMSVDTYQTESELHPFHLWLSAGGANFSSSTMTIEVVRESTFFLLNMIMPIWLLTILSWTAFMIQPEKIDVRMSMVLTIMLGFIAFQFVVSDSMPKTGEESKLHRFMNLANLFIFFVGAESVIVYKMRRDDLAFLAFFLDARVVLDALGCTSKRDAANDRAPAAEEVKFDGTTSAAEKNIIDKVDLLALAVFPVAFSVRSWVIFRDPAHEAMMILFVSLAAGNIIAASGLLVCMEAKRKSTNAPSASAANQQRSAADPGASGASPTMLVGTSNPMVRGGRPGRV